MVMNLGVLAPQYSLYTTYLFCLCLPTENNPCFLEGPLKATKKSRPNLTARKRSFMSVRPRVAPHCARRSLVCVPSSNKGYPAS